MGSGNGRFEFAKRARQEMEKLESEVKSGYADAFLSSVFGSFLLFKPIYDEARFSEFLPALLDGQNVGQINVDDPEVFNVTDIFSVEEIGECLWIGKVFLFPFIEVEYNRYNRNLSKDAIFSMFDTTFHRYVCVMEISGYVVVFTDITEDFFLKSEEKLAEKWFRKMEIHTIIPKIIGGLSEEFENGEASIGQLWLSFPLSMLGPHAEIIDKPKDGAKISKDENFKNIIRYWLLDSVLIKSKFKIAFNWSNERDKYALPGFLFSGGRANVTLLRNLRAFLDEIDSINEEYESERGFAWLPIYVIAWKREYRTWIDTPVFSISWTGDQFGLELDFDHGGEDSPWDSTVSGVFHITWIHPQYLKIWHSNDRKTDVFCHLKEKQNSDEWSFWEEEIRKIFGKDTESSCAEFLNRIRQNLSWRFFYASESMEPLPWHGHPNLMSSDLLLTATLDSNPHSDYLIKITNPKNGTAIGREELWKKISVELYRLSCFGFWMDAIQNAVDRYHNRVVKPQAAWSMEIYRYSPNDWWHRIMVCWNTFTKIWIACPPTDADKRKHYPVRYNKPESNTTKYVANALPFEDLISLAFIESLKTNHAYDHLFFWGKGPGLETRELADLIAIKSMPKDAVEISIFHIKPEPFEQKWYPSLDASFSLYTTVVWQTLEKMKPFLSANKVGEFLSELEKYFLLRNGTKSANYEIFETVRRAVLASEKKKLRIRVYFPIRESDYFPPRSSPMNSLKTLALETNWKRLKIISDIFDANVSSSNPSLDMEVGLWLVICRWITPSWLKDHTKVEMSLLWDVKSLWS